MACFYCDGNNYIQNGTAGWFCWDCEKFFDEPWYPEDHEQENEDE